MLTAVRMNKEQRQAVMELQKFEFDIRRGVPYSSSWWLASEERLMHLIPGAYGLGYAKLRFMRGTGAAVAPFLKLFTIHLMYFWGLHHRVEMGQTSSKITSYLLRWLPWLALATAQLLGLHPLNFLLMKPFGWALLAVAIGLSFCAHLFAKRFVSVAAQVEPDPGLWLDLVGSAIKQGAGINRVIGALRKNAPVAECQEVESQVRQALNDGGSVASQLEVIAQSKRQTQLAEKEEMLEKLPFKLLLPLGAFLIPQFVILLVLPMVLTAVTSNA